MRVLVEELHVGVRRRAVEVEVVLLHILAVVALAVSQAKEPFLENRILAVPQSQREAEMLFVIGNAADAVLAPAVGARASMIMGEKIPGVTVFAVVLADRAPLALSEIRAPLLPRHALVTHTFQPLLFYNLTNGNRGIFLNLRLDGS